MKKIILSLLVLVFGLTSCTKEAVEPIAFTKDNNKVQIYFFHGAECPHCINQQKTWDEILPKYPNVELIKFEVWHDKNNSDLMSFIGEKKGLSLNSVPLSFIGDQGFVGENKDDVVKKLDGYTQNFDTYKDTIAPIIEEYNNKITGITNSGAIQETSSGVTQ